MEGKKDFKSATIEFLEDRKILDSNVKKSLFVLGASTKLVMEFQRQKNINGDIFKKCCKRLRMTSFDILNLHNEIVTKLNVDYVKEPGFNRYYISQLLKVSNDLMKDENFKHINVNDLNFYFANGITLAFDLVKYISKETKEEIEILNTEENENE